MRFFKKTNINFLSIRHINYFVSIGLLIAGLASLAIKGIPLGIDFLGGTELLVRFDQKIEIGQVRGALDKSNLGKSEIKTYGEANTLLIRTTEQAEGTIIGDRIKKSLEDGLTNTKFQVLKEDKIGPKMGKELRRDAFYSVLASLIVIMLYIWVRFQFSFGFGAFISLFHDVLVALGIYSLLDGVLPGVRFEVTQEVIAACLTLVGVSINDTVVVFDRIRENLRIYKSLPLVEIMNKSINETLSRTVITSGTILLVLLVLLFFGGEVNRGFAFTMTIGIITGTYSSIYVASAIALDWQNYRAKAKEKTLVSKHAKA
jgi:preprotein translocase subunit SecF